MLFQCVLGLSLLAPMQPKDDYTERRSEYLKLYAAYKQAVDDHQFALAHSRRYHWHSWLDPVEVEAIRVERDRLRREMLLPRYAGLGKIHSEFFYLPWYFAPQYFWGWPGFWFYPGEARSAREHAPAATGTLRQTAPGILELVP